METEVIYVNVPIELERSLEDLAMRNRQQARGPRTLMGLVSPGGARKTYPHPLWAASN